MKKKSCVKKSKGGKSCAKKSKGSKHTTKRWVSPNCRQWAGGK